MITETLVICLSESVTRVLRLVRRLAFVADFSGPLFDLNLSAFLDSVLRTLLRAPRGDFCASCCPDHHPTMVLTFGDDEMLRVLQERAINKLVLCAKMNVTDKKKEKEKVE